MQAAGARRLQRARRGQQVCSAHASMCAPPPHFRLRSIGTDPMDCLLLSGASRTTPFDFLGAAGSRLEHGELHVEGCSVGSRGRVFAREARGWGGWSGQDHLRGAAHPLLSLFRHDLFSVAGCSHHPRGTLNCAIPARAHPVASVCVPRTVSPPRVARTRDTVGPVEALHTPCGALP